jgi:hypothetical protein
LIEWTQLVINPIVISNKQMICVPVSVVANGTPVKMINVDMLNYNNCIRNSLINKCNIPSRIDAVTPVYDRNN